MRIPTRYELKQMEREQDKKYIFRNLYNFCACRNKLNFNWIIYRVAFGYPISIWRINVCVKIFCVIFV